METSKNTGTSSGGLMQFQPLKKTDLVKGDWLYTAITEGVKRALIGPIITVSSNTNDRRKLLEDVFTHDGVKPKAIILSRYILQYLLPKDHLIVTIYCIPKENQGVELTVQLFKLSLEESPKEAEKKDL